jgi:hypothetical protein
VYDANTVPFGTNIIVVVMVSRVEIADDENFMIDGMFA